MSLVARETEDDGVASYLGIRTWRQGQGCSRYPGRQFIGVIVTIRGRIRNHDIGGMADPGTGIRRADTGTAARSRHVEETVTGGTELAHGLHT